MRNVLRALQFFRADTPRVAGVLVLLLGVVGLNLLKPWPLALIVDSALGNKPVPAWFGGLGPRAGGASFVAVCCVLIFALHAGHAALSATQNYFAIAVGLRGLQRVRNAVFARLQRLSLKFHQGSRTGDLIHRAAWDTYAFQNLFQQGLLTFVTALLSLGLMLVVMVRLNGRLALVAAGLVPLLLLAIKLFGRPMRERGATAQQADSHVTSLVQQNIAALPLIQSYTREEQEQKMFTTQTAAAQQKRLSQHGWELLYWLGIAGVFGLGTAAIVWVGAAQVQAGRLTVGGLLVFLAYLTQLYEPLNQLSHVGATVASAGAGTQRVFEVLDSNEVVKEAPDARSVVRSASSAGTPSPNAAHPPLQDGHPLTVRGELTFDQVSFGYQDAQPVLREVSFTLRAGESAAIIGPSGAGKTTLLNLLPRFFDPTNGAVRLDGTDLRELRLRDLRSCIAVVMQEPVLLPASIAENIAFGKPGATPAEIEAAARAASAHEFIARLPQQYDTVVGEGAARLSVGEKQRLSLARAFLKDAPVLLLDEPTSALDAASEALVVASLNELMRGRTTLMVAHRLSTIRRVDKILVLEEGRLVEMGAHDELLQRGGYYSRVATGQVGPG